MEKQLKLEDYVHPSLEIEVPIEIRKQVYEKAIELVEIPYIFESRDKTNGLCVILPCVLWGLRYFLDDMPNGKDWCFTDTPKAFPELTDHRLAKIRNEPTNQFRKQILQEMLNELNNK